MPTTSVIGTRAIAVRRAGPLVLPGRVLIAFDDPPLEPNPTWTRIDDTENLVAGFDIRRGRQTERDSTDTGTATVYVNDTEGLFDAAYPLSPYYGKLDGKQIQLQVWNPVDEVWVPQFRGVIDDYGYDINPTQVVANVQIDCVDIFDYLSGYQVQPGVNGDTPPAGSEGVIFYEDTAGTVDDRIIQVLTEAGIDSSMRVVFSGNVKLQETKYDPGDALLNVLRDCADAEFPGIANIYVDKTGRFVFHGRYSRFDPFTVSADAGPGVWDFQYWKVGDAFRINFDDQYAQARVLSYSRPRSELINSAICYPRGIVETAIPGQVYESAISIASYGKHSWSATDLIISEGTTTGNTADQETFLYGKFYVENQKNPGPRIKTITVKSLPPDDPRGPRTWSVLTGVDISDLVNVGVGYAGGIGIDGIDFYCEGVTMRVRPLNTDYDLVELDLDLSLAAWSMDGHGVFF